MSTKVAVIIGDYSNGWSDSMVVQTHTKVKNISDVHADRKGTLQCMNGALLEVVSFMEKSDAINPVPKDDPCCVKFIEWTGTLTETDKICKFCPHCGKIITPERKAKFIRS